MIEYLILAPLELEIQALLRAFDSLDCTSRSLHDGTTYFEIRCRTRSGELADIRIVQLNHQGILRAAVTSSRLIDWWRPSCVVSFGIAGGFVDTGDISFEDVVVAEQIFYYEPAKETAVEPGSALGSVQPGDGNAKLRRQTRFARLLPFPTDADLVAKCRNVWAERKPALNWRVRFGPIASGEKLIADIDSATRTAILSLNDKMLAVDMEAAGVAAGVNEMSLDDFPRRFLVVKGISDNASTSKSEQAIHREPAADNAAQFCRMMIESLPVEDDFQRLRKIDIHSIRTRATQICKYVNPLLQGGHVVTEDEIATLLLPGSATHVFYHWTLRTKQMHWVDFRFLLVLHHLKTLGFSPRLLISDYDMTITPDWRSSTEWIIRAVLGEDTPIYWYQDAKRQQEKYFRYAAWCGLSHDVLEAEFGEKEEILLKAFWIKFIGWEVRWLNRCLLLQWCRQAEATKRMSQMIVLRSVVLPTSDLILGKYLGKWEGPGATIFIEPPLYKSLLDWLESSPAPALVEQLLDHLSVDRTEVTNEPTDLTMLLDGRVSLRERMARSDDIPQAELRLLNTLARWNTVFFGKAT